MRFRAEHRFRASPEALAEVLADPRFYETLELPDVAFLDARATGTPTGASGAPRGVVVRYEFTGSLDGMARRLVGGARLTWAQELQLDGARGGSLAFSAEANPRLLHGSASFVFDRTDDGGRGASAATVRRLEGDLTVGLPGLGSVAERRLVPGIVRRLDVEAAALRDRLGTPG